MAILLVTYDLKQPGRNYQPVYEYLKRFTYCKGIESVWLLDTTSTNEYVRDALMSLADSNDIIFVTRLARQEWSPYNFGCATWLNQPNRNW